MQQLQPNTLLQGGKYKIINILGQGGFGITYLAIDGYNNRKVAIKEFFFKQYCCRDDRTSHVYVPSAENTQLVDRFKRKFKKEAKTIESLRHHNIIKVYETFEENDTFYYVMELIEGASLGDIIKSNGAFSVNDSLRFIRVVGDALGYIHDRKINHLDIKPDNIMLGKDGKITLIDFGVAKIYDTVSDGPTTTPLGISNGYSPYEQTYEGGITGFSPESDVYALAATLYKLLTGITPPPSQRLLDESLPLSPLEKNGVRKGVIAAIVNALNTRNRRTRSIRDFVAQLEMDDDEATRIIDIADEATIVINKENEETVANFSYPLTIHVNKKVYTECQLWTVKTISLQKTNTVVSMTVQSLDMPTTAWSGTGKIRTDEGVVYKQKSTSLPTKMDESFVIEEWRTLEVEDVYPPIPRDVTGISVLNDNIIIKGIELRNGNAYVPDANSEEYLDTTKEEYINKKRGQRKSYSVSMSSSDTQSEFSLKGALYIIIIIVTIVLIIKVLIS